jgi:ferrous iron transport protein B
VVCVNLIDEAQRRGMSVDDRSLARDLGVPVVLTAARERRGLDQLVSAVADVATGRFVTRPHRIQSGTKELREAVGTLAAQIEQEYPGLPNARWVALRLLDGDDRIASAVESGELADLVVGANLPLAATS